MTVAASAVEVPRIRPEPFNLRAETPRQLVELGRAANLSAGEMLQVLVTFAHDAIVLQQPTAHPFARRVRELAAQQLHPVKEVRTSFRLDTAPGGHTEAIRKLQAILQLPRRDLVVEYVTQAAWETRPTDGGGGSGKKGDPLDRSRALARFHNVDGSAARPPVILRSLPLPGFAHDEEGSSTKS